MEFFEMDTDHFGPFNTQWDLFRLIVGTETGRRWGSWAVPHSERPVTGGDQLSERRKEARECPETPPARGHKGVVFGP